MNTRGLSVVAVGVSLMLWTALPRSTGVRAAGRASDATAGQLAWRGRSSDDGLWRIIADRAAGDPARRTDLIGAFTVVRLHVAALAAQLAAAPVEADTADATGADVSTAALRSAGTASEPPEITLPLPEGQFGRFRVERSPLLAPALANAFPAVQTYRATSLDAPSMTARLDLTPEGFHAIIQRGETTVLVDPYGPDDRDIYVAYDAEDFRRSGSAFLCLADGASMSDGRALRASRESARAVAGPTRPALWRLAVAASGEYTVAVGGTKAAVVARVTTLVNRVQAVFERDAGARVILSLGSAEAPTALVFADAATDPFGADVGLPNMLAAQQTLDRVMGAGRYDVGHLLVLGSFGQAGLRGAGTAGHGVTGLSAAGDAVDVAAFAHELRHQTGEGDASVTTPTGVTTGTTGRAGAGPAVGRLDAATAGAGLQGLATTRELTMPVTAGAAGGISATADTVGGIITTVAGTGVFAYSPDGRTATSSELTQVPAIALDGSGNLYVTDEATNRIRKVTAATGILTTVAGMWTGSMIGAFAGDGGPATSAQIYGPVGIAFDPAGNLYIADARNNRVRKVIAATGIITTVAGNGSEGFSGDGGPATGAAFKWITAVATDAAGNLYVSDGGNNRIRKVTAATGIVTTVVGTGVAGFSGDGGAATGAAINRPAGMTFDAAGKLYFADYSNDRIRTVDVATGVITTVAGNGGRGHSGDGGPATGASLNNPSAVAFDAAGNLFVADERNNVVRKVTAATGIITVVAGNGTRASGGDGGLATSAALSWPDALAFDAAGNLYIGDQTNYRVRRVTPPTPAPVVIAFPPRNESLEFRNQLEIKYRDGLRRPATSTFVDLEGDIVWVQEYFRYRVNLCGHQDAAQRVFDQIAGQPAAPVCGSPSAGVVQFPPRDEALDFRRQLETVYRDLLRRTAVATFVDLEGDIVWVQEYLRYRVNRCGHADATQKVFLQIDGFGVQPVCG